MREQLAPLIQVGEPAPGGTGTLARAVPTITQLPLLRYKLYEVIPVVVAACWMVTTPPICVAFSFVSWKVKPPGTMALSRSTMDSDTEFKLRPSAEMRKPRKCVAAAGLGVFTGITISTFPAPVGT